ncbi:DUF4396 domain-containing protein [Rubellicoccus peritrichatus]|uniref:DUF4396 domain-containing protein n=1 Tax=Rubellicoccus peritrichatus TaxID=3080537 RepID=A0AAQ3LEX5_9BACT|nr:DUF4396 domain-containing protein [Puniceicoccus sp. CR14]WOO43477.1 DUF4396 domain-containing protein [Puniceicoccus sp. CR14]
MDLLIYLWFTLVALSLIVLIWDLTTHTPTGTVMKVAWILVVAYTGPIGFALFWKSCRQPKGIAHDVFIRDHWRQATGSLLHCVAGDATGIIIAAAVVYHFGLPNGIDLVIEYLAAFVVGLFVFQALFMIKMFQGDYWLAVRKTFFAETVSMNMVMLGMFPSMLLLKLIIPNADSPYNAEFWFLMSMATIVGMATAYPINSWMVRRGLKHGMMSAMPKGDHQTAHGGEHQHQGHEHDKHQQMHMEMHQQEDEHMKHDENGHMHEHEDMPTRDHAHAEHKHGSHGEMVSHGAHSGHQAKSLPTAQIYGIILGTFALLIIAVALTSLAVPISFSR